MWRDYIPADSIWDGAWSQFKNDGLPTVIYALLTHMLVLMFRKKVTVFLVAQFLGEVQPVIYCKSEILKVVII